MRKSSQLGIFMYGVAGSLVIGLVAAAFLVLSHELIALIWHDLPGIIPLGSLYPLVIGLIGGVLVGYGRKNFGPVPKTIATLIGQYKETRSGQYDSVQKSFLLALIVLGFGASLGPEAALLSILFSLAIRLADKIRYLYFNYGEVSRLSLKERWVVMLSPFNYFVIYNEANAIREKTFLKYKKLIYTIYWIVGVAFFSFLTNLAAMPSISVKLGASHLSSQEWLWLVPLFLLGLLFSYALVKLKHFFHQLMPNSLEKPLLYGLIGGLAIGISGMFLPVILFSGQDALKTIVADTPLTPLWLLFLLPFAKFILTEICLAAGWVGGDIFPLIYATIAFGFAVAMALPNLDTLFVVAIIAATATSLTLEIPLLGGLLLLLFFPSNLAPFVLVADGLASFVLPKVIAKVKGPATKVENN